MNFEKGGVAGIVGGVIAVAILVIIFIATGGQDNEQESMMVETEPEVMVEMSETDEILPVVEPEEEVSDEEDPITEDLGDEPVTWNGDVLAGNGQAILLDFDQGDYEQALASGQPVFLYFYAKWCPSCRAEVPKMQAAFNDESIGAVAGFRVNYKDNDTDDFEKDLAREFGIGYQHTKVALVNGERVLKSPEQWDTPRYLSELTNIIQ